MTFTFEEIEDYCESLVMRRLTKSELEEVLTKHFNKEIRLSDTTEDLDDEFDYRLTGNLFGDDDDICTSYIDVDFYYLPMRDGETLYITEVNVETY